MAKHKKEQENKTKMAKEEVSYIEGNKFNPVVVLGDDPSNGTEGNEEQDNVLVAHFVRVESVPRDTVYDEVGVEEE